MKNVKNLIIVFICTLAISISSATAQDETFVFPHRYDTWVKLEDDSTIKGSLIELRKDKIVVQGNNGTLSPIIYDSHVDNLKFRKKGAITKGILIGTATGGILGALTGYQAGKPSECDNCWSIDLRQEMASVFGLGGAAVGGIIGGFIGSKKIKININTNKNFNKNQIRKIHKKMY